MMGGETTGHILQAGRSRAKERAFLTAPYIVFAGSLVLTGAVAYFAWQNNQGESEVRFQNLVVSIVRRVQERVSANMAALQAARALMHEGPRIPQENLEDFVRLLQPRENYPGIRGLGANVRITRGEADAFVRSMRASFPEVGIWPLSDNDELFPTTILAPLNPTSKGRLGYDPFANPTRRRAMEMARDSDAPVATDPLTLEATLGPGPPQTNFVVYVPLYKGAAPATVEERREALSGYVSTACSPADLFAGVSDQQAAFQVFDGNQLLYTSAEWNSIPRTSPRSITSVQAFGRTWNLHVGATGAYREKSDDYYLPHALALAGAILSAALFFITRAEVAARSKAERQGEELRLFKAAVDNAAEAVVIMYDQNARRVVEYVNPAYCAMTGYSFKEAIGSTPGILRGPKTDEAEIARLNQALLKGEIFKGETIIYRKDGSEFLRQWHVAPIRDASGKVGHYVSFQRDVTAQRQTEEALHKATVQDQRRRVSHQMLQVLMHEIRNPLTGILGNLQLLEGDHVPPQVRQCHEEIKQCAHAIDAALRQLAKLDLENPTTITGND